MLSLLKNPRYAGAYFFGRARSLVLKRSKQWITGHRSEESLERLPAEYRSQDAAADLEAIRDAIADLNPEGLITLEMAKTAQRMLAVSIPEVASLDVANTFTKQFAAGQ